MVQLALFKRSIQDVFISVQSQMKNPADVSDDDAGLDPNLLLASCGGGGPLLVDNSAV